MDKEQLTKGTVYLVGAGPGDPGLLTLRTRSLIENCDVLIFDNLANRRLHDWAPLECERIDVGKSPGRHTMEQSEIGKLLVSKAKEGLRVVRLKGGDPFVFGPIFLTLFHPLIHELFVLLKLLNLLLPPFHE